MVSGRRLNLSIADPDDRKAHLHKEIQRLRRENHVLRGCLDMIGVPPEEMAKLKARRDEDDVKAIVIVRWRQFQWMEAGALHGPWEPGLAQVSAKGVIDGLRGVIEQRMERDLNPSNGGDGS